MNKNIDLLFDDLLSKDNEIRLNALTSLLTITDNEVDWFEKKYNELLSKLSNSNSYQRSIGIMLICNLAKSDKRNLIKNDLQKILEHIQDEKFITSRQCILNIWKIAVVNKANQDTIINRLKTRYSDCQTEKHYNLFRQDIIQSLFKISTILKNGELKKDIFELIDMENEIKYKDKYIKILKNT